MTLPKSHKNSVDPTQSQQHAHTGTSYGQEKGDHPGRKVADPEQVKSMFRGLGFWPTSPDPFSTPRSERSRQAKAQSALPPDEYYG